MVPAEAQFATHTAANSSSRPDLKAEDLTDHGDPSPHGALGGQQLGSPENAETGLRKPLSAPVCKKMFKIPSRTQTWHVEQDF